MDIAVVLALTVPVVIGLVEVVKRAVGLSDRFAPVLALIVGIGVTVLASYAGSITPPLTASQSAFYGLVAGLASSGLYSGWKASIATP